ncbi:MAG: hypothetical protein LBN02_01785 [Oscillospiraceae bacterium]|jgi:hypothetical protein|nr:hypothetical protein [Oscillospiraceae bacterium]
MKQQIENATWQLLDEKAREDVLTSLFMYPYCNVIFEYGRWNVSPHECLKASYGADRKHYGRIYAHEIYTDYELEANLAELNKSVWY